MSTEKNSSKKVKAGAMATGGSRRASVAKPAASKAPVAEQTQQAITKEKVVVTQAELIQQMYNSPINLVAALCNDENNMRIFKEEEVDILLKPMFLNEESKNIFWSYMNTALIQARNRLPVGSDAGNLRFVFNLIKEPSDQIAELTLDIYCMLPEVLENCNDNCVPATKVVELRKKYADKNQVIAFQLGGTALNVVMWNGKQIVFLAGSFSIDGITPTHSQFGGPDGEFHKLPRMQVEVEETTNGLKDHMAHHEAPPSETLDESLCEEALCDTKLGFHHDKGWCVINKDGSMMPILNIANMGSEDDIDIRALMSDLNMLRSNINHVEETLLFRAKRNTKRLMGSFENMMEHIFGDRPKD